MKNFVRQFVSVMRSNTELNYNYNAFNRIATKVRWVILSKDFVEVISHVSHRITLEEVGGTPNGRAPKLWAHFWVKRRKICTL